MNPVVTVRRMILPPKFKFLYREFGDRPFSLLDVGAGNHSASLTCRRFPHCEYYGIDSSLEYNNDEYDIRLAKKFWTIDLTSLQFDRLPDEYFDALMFSHVIEHLFNGTEVIRLLIAKLRRQGVVYIEYPGFHSTKLASMRGTLNFFDDPTHCRIYSLREIYNLLLLNGCSIISGGKRRDKMRALLTPGFVINRVLKEGHPLAGDLFDLVGSAEYVFARRTD